MKTRLLTILLTLLPLMAWGQSTNAEPYAVLSNDGKMVTFYYDDQRNERGGIDINNSYVNNIFIPTYGTATTAVFDATFANYRPTSTMCWFMNCSLLTSIIGVENLKTDKVTDMSWMFYGCSGLTSLDVSNFKTDNVKNMQCMFFGCSGLTSLDVSGFNTESVTNIGTMFYGCSGLTSLDVSNFKTDNVTYMGGMFDGCSGLTSLDISNFKTDNVTDMNDMFFECSSLTSLNVSNINTANVTNMISMFSGCSALTSLDVSGFNTDNVTSMSGMFHGCSGLTSLDLSNFNTVKVTKMSGMFSGCSGLKTIYVGEEWHTSAVTEGGYMFTDCNPLVGGKGTIFDPNHTDYTYARIDGGPNSETPGYFTRSGDAPYVASEPYAVLSDNNTVLTFYYDEKKEERNGMSVAGSFGYPDYQPWLGQAESITTAVFDASFANCTSITSTAYWFYECKTLTAISGISNLHTANVTDMTYMFYGCSGLTSLDVSGFNTSNVTSTSGMFSGCSGLTSLDVSKFYTANVTSTSGMFSGCSGLTSLDVSHFNTANVTQMGYMFDGCSGLTSLDVSNFNTTNVHAMFYMFRGCSGLTSLDMSNFNTADVDHMGRMFWGCSGLKTIYVGEGWNTSAVTKGTSMFANCTNLKGGKGTTYDVNHIDYTYAHIDGGPNNPGYFTDKDAVDAPTFRFEGDSLYIETATKDASIFYQMADLPNMDEATIEKIKESLTVTADAQQSIYYEQPIELKKSVVLKAIAAGAKNSEVSTLVYDYDVWQKLMDAIWLGNEVLEQALDNKNVPSDLKDSLMMVVSQGQSYYDDRAELDSSVAENAIQRIYDYVYAVEKYLKDSEPEPYAVLTGDTISGMKLTFYYDQKKIERNGMGVGPFEVTQFDDYFYVNSEWDKYSDHITTVVFDDSFADCHTITSTAAWFYGFSKLTTITNIGNLKTDNVYSMGDMFWGCISLETLDISGFNTENVVDFGGMFGWCSSLKSLDVNILNTSSSTWMRRMFSGCSNLTSLDVSKFTTENVTNMLGMFEYCPNLTSVDVSGFNTANVTDMSSMFFGCSGLTSLDVSGFNTENVTTMWGMFADCSSLTSLDVSHFDTKNVTTTTRMFDNCMLLSNLDVSNFNTDNNIGLGAMFRGCAGLTSLEVNRFNTSNVQYMWSMFEGCTNLTSLDVSGFKTDKVIDMSCMFFGCSNLTSLDVSGFNTQNVTNMGIMFANCNYLTSLDVSGFKTGKVTDLSNMFYGCSNLTNLDVSGFNTEVVTDMKGMFYNCSGLTNLDVSKFNTGNVTEMRGMFGGCSGLTSLDLSSFNTVNVTDIGVMFSKCSGLTTICVGNDWTTSAVTDGDNIFFNCVNLIGGMGTTYDANHVDYTYAHIDEGPSNPGYFTRSGDSPYVAPDYTFDNNGVLTVGGSTSLADALEAAGGRGEVAKTITAIVWNSTATLTNDDLKGLDNPNMLIYVKGAAFAPENRDNVVIGDFAKNIVLTDVESGNNNFYCPQAFTAEMISYTRNFQQQTEIGVSRGWESIALPFTVQTIMHEKNGLIAPFGNDASGKHFWLRQLTQEGLARATTIEANTPYIISMPNSSEYPADYCLNGRVTFSSQDALVPVTEIRPFETHHNDGSMLMFVPCFQRQSANDMIYALNVGEQRGGYPEGSVFEANYREVRPFEAFTVHEGGQRPAPQYISIDEMNGGATGIDSLTPNPSPKGEGSYYSLDGRRLQKKPTQNGVYILNGRLVVIK